MGRRMESLSGGRKDLGLKSSEKSLSPASSWSPKVRLHRNCHAMVHASLCNTFLKCVTSRILQNVLCVWCLWCIHSCLLHVGGYGVCFSMCVMSRVCVFPCSYVSAVCLHICGVALWCVQSCVVCFSMYRLCMWYGCSVYCVLCSLAVFFVNICGMVLYMCGVSIVVLCVSVVFSLPACGVSRWYVCAVLCV